MNLLKEGR